MADPEETIAVAGKLAPGDSDGWYTALTELGARNEAIAEACDRAGHRVSAVQAYLRAANYPVRGVLVHPRHEHADDWAQAWRAHRACLDAALARWPTPPNASTCRGRAHGSTRGCSHRSRRATATRTGGAAARRTGGPRRAALRLVDDRRRRRGGAGLVHDQRSTGRARVARQRRRRVGADRRLVPSHRRGARRRVRATRAGRCTMSRSSASPTAAIWWSRGRARAARRRGGL